MSIDVDQPSLGARPTRRPALGRYAVTVLAIGAQLLIGGAILVSGLVVPDDVRIVFGIGWLLGTVVMSAAWRHPGRLLLVPTATWLCIVLTVVVGDIWLGWTA